MHEPRQSTPKQKDEDRIDSLFANALSKTQWAPRTAERYQLLLRHDEPVSVQNAISGDLASADEFQGPERIGIILGALVTARSQMVVLNLLSALRSTEEGVAKAVPCLLLMLSSPSLNLRFEVVDTLVDLVKSSPNVKQVLVENFPLLFKICHDMGPLPSGELPQQRAKPRLALEFMAFLELVDRESVQIMEEWDRNIIADTKSAPILSDSDLAALKFKAPMSCDLRTKINRICFLAYFDTDLRGQATGRGAVAQAQMEALDVLRPALTLYYCWKSLNVEPSGRQQCLGNLSRVLGTTNSKLYPGLAAVLERMANESQFALLETSKHKLWPIFQVGPSFAPMYAYLVGRVCNNMPAYLMPSIRAGLDSNVSEGPSVVAINDAQTIGYLCSLPAEVLKQNEGQLLIELNQRIGQAHSNQSADILDALRSGKFPTDFILPGLLAALKLEYLLVRSALRLIEKRPPEYIDAWIKLCTVSNELLNSPDESISELANRTCSQLESFEVIAKIMSSALVEYEDLLLSRQPNLEIMKRYVDPLRPIPFNDRESWGLWRSQRLAALPVAINHLLKHCYDQARYEIDKGRLTKWREVAHWIKEQIFEALKSIREPAKSSSNLPLEGAVARLELNNFLIQTDSITKATQVPKQVAESSN